MESCVAVSLQKLCQQNIIFSETQLTASWGLLSECRLKGQKATAHTSGRSQGHHARRHGTILRGHQRILSLTKM